MKIITGILTVGVFLLGQVHAQAPAETLDFKKAMGLAYQHHPAMVEGRKALNSAQGELITTRGLPNPELELEFGKSHLDAIEVRQPLEPLGVRFLKSRIAGNDIKIHQEQLRSAWALAYVQVWRQYSDVIINNKKLDLAQQNLETVRQFFGKVQLRYEGGRTLKNELQRAKIELLKAESGVLQAQARVKTNKAQLNLSLGRAVDLDFETQEQLTEQDLDLDLDQVKSRALAQRPDIKTAGLELDSSRKNLAKEQLSRLPSYFIGFRKSDKDYDEDYAVLLGVSVPIWNLNQGEVRKARARQEFQEARSEAVINQALLDIYSAFWDVEFKKKQLDLFKASLAESHELLRLANTHYGEGKIDFLNYLDQVTASMQAKTGYYEALLDYSQSISRLETSMSGSLRGEEGFNEKP